MTAKASAGGVRPAPTSTFSSKISEQELDAQMPLETRGPVVSAATAVVASLVSVSSVPPSSVKVTLTLMVLPRSAAFSL